MLGNWRGVFGAPGITAAQRDALVTAVKAGDRIGGLEGDARPRCGWEPVYLGGDAFKTFLDEDTKRIAGILDSLGLREVSHAAVGRGASRRARPVAGRAGARGLVAAVVAFQLPEAGGYARDRPELHAEVRLGGADRCWASGCWPRCSRAAGANAVPDDPPSAASTRSTAARSSGSAPACSRRWR